MSPLQEVTDALRALLLTVKVHPEMQKREYVSLGIQVNNALARAERELSGPPALYGSDLYGSDLYGSDLLASTYSIVGHTLQLGDIVRQAFVDSRLTPEAWNNLSRSARERKLFDALLLIRSKIEAESDPNPPWQAPS